MRALEHERFEQASVDFADMHLKTVPPRFGAHGVSHDEPEDVRFGQRDGRENQKKNGDAPARYTAPLCTRVRHSLGRGGIRGLAQNGAAS